MERLGTAKCGWQKLLSTNDSSSDFAARIPTTTKPTTNIVDRNLTVIENTLMIVWFGAGSENNTYNSRIIGWNKASPASGTGTLWIPTPLAEFVLTLSATIGIAGSDAIATDLFADTIVGATWNPAGGSEIVSPTGDLIAHVVLDAKGCDLIQIDFDMVTATNGNAFVRWL